MSALLTTVFGFLSSYLDSSAWLLEADIFNVCDGVREVGVLDEDGGNVMLIMMMMD